MVEVQIKQTKDEFYRVFNFHHDELLHAIQNWYQYSIAKPLLLQGKSGFGRKYALESALYQMSTDCQIIKLNASTLDQPIENIEQLISPKAKLSPIQKELLGEIKQYVKDAQIQNDSGKAGWAIVANLGLVINLTEIVWDYFRKVDKTIFQLTPEDYIADLLRTLCKNKTIVLHLENAESSPQITETLLRISKRHNVSAHASYSLNHCLVACNCSDSQSFSDNYALDDNDYKSLSFAPLSITDLAIVLPNRKIYLHESILKLLMLHGDTSQQTIYPEDLNKQLQRLNNEGLLLHTSEGFQLNTDTKNAEILSIIGSPLTDHYEKQLKTIQETTLRKQVKQYLATAALCGSHYIPQIPLLYALNLDYYQDESDQKRGDLILDTIEDCFQHSELKMFSENLGIIHDIEDSPLYSYQFKHPLLQDYLTSSWSEQEKVCRAERLLTDMNNLLPHKNNATNELLWHLAQIVGERTQEQWFESLYFHVMGDQVDSYKKIIKKRINSGYSEPVDIIEHAIKQDHYPAYVHFLRVTLEACWEYMDRTEETSGLLNTAGAILDDRGEYKLAIDYFNHALEITRNWMTSSHECIILNNLSISKYHLGNITTALQYAEEALQIAYEINNQELVASVLNILSSIYATLGDEDKAFKSLKQALAICKLLGLHIGLSTTLNNISEYYISQGNTKKAREYLETSLTLSHTAGHKTGEAFSLNNLGKLIVDTGDTELAVEYFERALSIHQSKGNKLGELIVLNNISAAYHKQDKKELSFKTLKNAHKIASSIGHLISESQILNNLGALADEEGDTINSIGYLNRSINISRKIGDKSGECTTMINIGIFHWKNEKIDEAIKYLVHSHSIAAEMRNEAALKELHRFAESMQLDPPPWNLKP